MGWGRVWSNLFDVGNKNPLEEPDHLIEVRKGCTPEGYDTKEYYHHDSRIAAKFQFLAVSFFH